MVIITDQSNVGNWELWGPLRERYETRAKAGGPYRLLALDGGGIHGLITFAVLRRLEELLAGALGYKEFRLCDFRLHRWKSAAWSAGRGVCQRRWWPRGELVDRLVSSKLPSKGWRLPRNRRS
jgi:hypothetical protein